MSSHAVLMSKQPAVEEEWMPLLLLLRLGYQSYLSFPSRLADGIVQQSTTRAHHTQPWERQSVCLRLRHA